MNKPTHLASGLVALVVFALTAGSPAWAQAPQGASAQPSAQTSAQASAQTSAQASTQVSTQVSAQASAQASPQASAQGAPAQTGTAQGVPAGLIWQPGQLKPVDSALAAKVGDKAPDFDLPTIDGKRVSLAQFLGKKNVVLTFVPAAWTPVCSGQWPGYNMAKELFASHDAVLIGVSVDNIPTLNAWVAEMGGLWFPVASDFWPHGKLAQELGVLRSDGTTERALVVINKQGVIHYIDVCDINVRPDLGTLASALATLPK